MRGAPQRGLAHLSYEISNFSGFRRPSDACPAFPSPVQPESFAAPGEDGLRLKDPGVRAPALPQARQPNPKHTIRNTQANSSTTGRSLQYKKLMTQGQNLSLQASAGAQGASQGRKENVEDGQHENGVAYRLRIVNSMESVSAEFSVWTGQI